MEQIESAGSGFILDAGEWVSKAMWKSMTASLPILAPVNVATLRQ